MMKQRIKTWTWIIVAGIGTGVFLGNQNKFMDVNSAACNWNTPGGWCPTIFSWKWFFGGLGILIMIGFLIEITTKDEEK